MKSLSTSMQTQQRKSQNMSVFPPPTNKRTQSAPETGVLRRGGALALGGVAQPFVRHGGGGLLQTDISPRTPRVV